MNFFKIFLTLLFFIFSSASFADNHSETENQAVSEIDMDVTEKAKEVIMPLIEAGKEVHLNLKEVQYMDSSGISVLIESHQKAAELGSRVVLKEISKSVLKVIMMAKLEQILIIE